MEYTYNTRQKYAETKKREWLQASKPQKLKLLHKDIYELFEEINEMGERYNFNCQKCVSFWEARQKGEPFSVFMKKHCKGLVELFVPKELIADYYAIIDKIPGYPYTRGYNRRTARCCEKEIHVMDVFELLYSYMVFGTYGVSVADYLTDKLPEEALDFKRNYNQYGPLHLARFDEIIAASVLNGNEKTIAVIEEAFLSENNNVIVTTDMIRAVVKSENTKLHELVAGFMVAGRLQEGIRQAVCENADCGTVSAFLIILKYIEQENMLRFSGVKRAVATWTGICDENSLERISDKQFTLICRGVNDLDEARKMIDTQDSMQIVIGLWAIGFYEVKDAIAEMKKIAASGTKSQLLAISYYNRALQQSHITGKVSSEIFEKYEDDYEILAAFMPTYLNNTESIVRKTFDRVDKSTSFYDTDAEYTYKTVRLDVLFDSEDKARRHYAILKQAAENMTKRKQEFSPCIFPWYGVLLQKSDFIRRMSLIAYALQDQTLIDDVCTHLSDIDGIYADRSSHIRMLLHDPQTDVQKKALLSYVADKESYSRQTAYSILKRMELDADDYEQLEGYLKYKTDTIRQYTISLLEKRDAKGRKESISRLIASSNENTRLAGLDLIKSDCEKAPDKKPEFAAFLKAAIADKENLSEPEKVLYEEITGAGGAGNVLTAKGYGLYNPDADIQIPVRKGNVKIVSDYFSVEEKELDYMFEKITAVLKNHAKDEYKDGNGEIRLLGNGLYLTTYDHALPIEEKYPFLDLWKKMYADIIQTPKNFWNLYIALQSGFKKSELKDYASYISAEKGLFRGCNSDYELKNKVYESTIYRPHGDLQTIFSIMISTENLKLPREVSIETALYAIDLPENKKWYEPVKPKDQHYYYYSAEPRKCFAKSFKVGLVIAPLTNWKNEEEFKESFAILRRLDESYQFQKNIDTPNYGRSKTHNYLSVLSYIKACEFNLIPKDVVYRYAFEGVGLPIALEQLGWFMMEKLTPLAVMNLKSYMPVDENAKTADHNHPFFKMGQQFYTSIVDKVLDVELKRGDSPTIFSDAIGKITCVYGVDRLMAILTALGKETLDRNTYYYWSRTGKSKKECLSHLLQVCYPLPEDSMEKFSSGAAQHKITQERLIETAMYAPQWMNMVENYLGCEGFTSCCYYFMAHMNERFDDKKKAMIAKYTPLTPEELNDGCFDVEWFSEAYRKLGDRMFTKLYKAAKYISDGSKHTRARKYADAALGKVTVEELEAAIKDKRNKDLLMSYGLVPIAGEKDQLHRYEFLQNFLKESKQFGAQRRASEAKCVEVALKNLATSAGYSDDLRLILAMETALVTSNARYFEGIAVQNGEYTIAVNVNLQGKAELEICKEDKKLKTIPAALKKDEEYLSVKEFVTKLKNQYSRCVKMFENAMEEREKYSLGELDRLTSNPVIGAILDKLVFVKECDTEDELALLQDFTEKEEDKDSTLLRVAHPVDLYNSGKWDTWQKYFFELQQETGAKQPFKQVFRELYVKLEEEKDQIVSRMFAGNQIQTGKTLGVLKNRRWIADYENGLQKIYYKDNIIATIYAMADWFSPADVEEPALEYVAFYDRKSFKQLKLSEIPDIIYSEVMRDTDLAVSVAHAGGVDPLTSHSTIQMRTVIFKFNAELFKLDNVKFEGNHAFIKGKYGEYSIHLGSGVIHMVNGHQINVLPVHSQKRGKLFLPFIDDDPKTAEIMSKILLFAQDDKIKDPYIMEQIR